MKEKKLNRIPMITFNKVFIYLLISAASILTFVSCEGVELNPENTVNIAQINEYGILADSLIEFQNEVKKNETLTDIFLPFNISYNEIYNLVQNSKGVFDVRKIKPGDKYTFYVSNDSSKSVKYFVYEEDAINYCVFDLRDSVNIYKAKKEVITKERLTNGTIEHSLYYCLEKQNADPNLALKLSDVFAWAIDFYSIQKGDNFKVLYDEIYVADKFYGVGRIKGAYFNHKGKDFLAYFFENENEKDYFDENGNSLKKAFLKAPLKFSRISSKFSPSRLHPVLKIRRPHLGVDFAAPSGTPILSIGDGIVTTVARNSGSGKYVKIKHNSVYSTGYLHMSRFAVGIKPGVKVRQGDVIGYVGSTGLSSGPHVDLRFWKNGHLVNFLKEEFPPSKPIDSKYKEEFLQLRDHISSKLFSADSSITQVAIN
ncbi:MAG: peptidoglycan DD-metalloendopeptidase family protein [Bacteroidetes bacterium]|nr:peptidoglycan DD-metalloendopeptidase family protein [Bacteroidota bacterium]